MQNLMLRTAGLAAALLFVAVASAHSQSPKWHGDGAEHCTPCADGVVSVARDADGPVEVEVLAAYCRPEKDTVWVHYAIRNVGETPIQAYEIETSERYERYRSESQGFGAEKLELAPGGQIERWAVCGGKVAADVSDPGRLTAVVLAVTKLRFTDETKWRPLVKPFGTPE